jgi:UDP-N-acetylglucosamine diphosphorylase/glucosamine-1-phosphate N-acetyltransferase
MKKLTSIKFFEDSAALTLEPLTLTRPVWSLQCGILSLERKIQEYLPGLGYSYFIRAYLSACLKGWTADGISSNDNLWINGSVIPGERFAEVLDLPVGTVWVQEGRPVAFRGQRPERWVAGTELPLDGFEKIEITSEYGRVYRYLWELVDAASAQVIKEARSLRKLGQNCGEMHPSVVLVGEQDICIAAGCQIGPYAVIDASAGPVVLDAKVQIGTHALIEGPTYLGAKSRIKPHAHVSHCCFGEETRVGGEVVDTIIQGFTNKQHGGFLGNSFLGSWCNLGSGTETSNLKNNYSNIKVQVGRELVDTGRLFVGLMMGDHSKSAIGSVFNTGTVVGVACNLIEPGFPPRNIPSFHWGGAEKLSPYPFNKTLEIARAVVARRGRSLADEDIQVLRWVFDNRVKEQVTS